jgi:glycosyltransferase involved in cell wall biosynthesis
MLARIFAARARAPYGLIFQDLMGPSARQSGIKGGARVARLTAALERWSVARARTVAVVSENFRPYLQGLGVSDARIVSLPNWAHVRAPSGDRIATRRRLGWPLESTVVLHAGNMGLKQGLEQVVEAGRRADELSAPVVFVLMGEGSQRAALEAQAAGTERIRFMPLQPEDDLPDILQAADVLLVSERPTVLDMSLPSKLTSYFAAGRPIVAAVVPTGSTAGEVLRSGAGMVVPSGHRDKLIEATLQLRADPDLAEGYGRAGKAYAASTLDGDHALARVDALLEQTLRPIAPTRGPG